MSKTLLINTLQIYIKPNTFSFLWNHKLYMAPLIYMQCYLCENTLNLHMTTYISIEYKNPNKYPQKRHYCF